jgi:hypothetical protein
MWLIIHFSFPRVTEEGYVVISNWYNDFTIRYGEQIIDNKSNQLSIGYWKDGLVVKESYNYPVISMA